MHIRTGRQYASRAFQDELTEYGMTYLMSRKGNYWDNAPTEELLQKPEKRADVRAAHATLRAQSVADLFDYIAVFSTAVGYRSPMQLLQDWITTQNT